MPRRFSPPPRGAFRFHSPSQSLLKHRRGHISDKIFLPRHASAEESTKDSAKHTVAVPNRKLLRPYAEETVLKREVQKSYYKAEREIERNEADAQEAARKKILAGDIKLDYRELQRLSKANGLPARGKRDVLERRLFNLFGRLDPANTVKMGRNELFNCREDLDNSPVEEEERTLKIRQGDTRYDEFDFRGRKHRLNFVADLPLLDRVRDQEIKEKTSDYWRFAGGKVMPLRRRPEDQPAGGAETKLKREASVSVSMTSVAGIKGDQEATATAQA